MGWHPIIGPTDASVNDPGCTCRGSCTSGPGTAPRAVLSADGVVEADRATGVLTDALNELVVARTGEADLARLAGIVATARSGLDATS